MKRNEDGGPLLEPIGIYQDYIHLNLRVDEEIITEKIASRVDNCPLLVARFVCTLGGLFVKFSHKLNHNQKRAVSTSTGIMGWCEALAIEQ